jgi:DnaK suppressor protein
MSRNKDARNRERYQVLKTMLEERHREIQDKLRTLRETLPAEVAEVKDAEEQSVNDFVRDVELALIEMTSETLTQIDEAMHKLEAGTYGVCANCGTEIAEARLKALPFATLCRSCQEAQESMQAEQREVRPFEAILSAESPATRRVR